MRALMGYTPVLACVHGRRAVSRHNQQTWGRGAVHSVAHRCPCPPAHVLPSGLPCPRRAERGFGRGERGTSRLSRVSDEAQANPPTPQRDSRLQPRSVRVCASLDPLTRGRRRHVTATITTIDNSPLLMSTTSAIHTSTVAMRRHDSREALHPWRWPPVRTCPPRLPPRHPAPCTGDFIAAQRPGRPSQPTLPRWEEDELLQPVLPPSSASSSGSSTPSSRLPPARVTTGRQFVSSFTALTTRLRSDFGLPPRPSLSPQQRRLRGARSSRDVFTAARR